MTSEDEALAEHVRAVDGEAFDPEVFDATHAVPAGVETSNSTVCRTAGANRPLALPAAISRNGQNTVCVSPVPRTLKLATVVGVRHEYG